jgi:hypothetical protein
MSILRFFPQLYKENPNPNLNPNPNRIQILSNFILDTRYPILDTRYSILITQYHLTKYRLF